MKGISSTNTNFEELREDETRGLSSERLNEVFSDLLLIQKQLALANDPVVSNFQYETRNGEMGIVHLSYELCDQFTIQIVLCENSVPIEKYIANVASDIGICGDLTDHSRMANFVGVISMTVHNKSTNSTREYPESTVETNLSLNLRLKPDNTISKLTPAALSNGYTYQFNGGGKFAPETNSCFCPLPLTIEDLSVMFHEYGHSKDPILQNNGLQDFQDAWLSISAQSSKIQNEVYALEDANKPIPQDLLDLKSTTKKASMDSQRIFALEFMQSELRAVVYAIKEMESLIGSHTRASVLLSRVTKFQTQILDQYYSWYPGVLSETVFEEKNRSELWIEEDPPKSPRRDLN